MIVFVAFVTLIWLNVAGRTMTKSHEDWILDTVGLFFQGILIPLLQITLVYQYHHLLPTQSRILTLHPIAAFLLSFVFVDYLYYWNHRFLHTRFAWNLHKVHHTMTQMDVLGTSRNTLWTSFFIIYLWSGSLFVYLLANPTWYIVGASLTSALDLWRHSTISPHPNSFLHRFLSPWLILPQDHAWHHASGGDRGNYAANIKWDKLHGTYFESDKAPDSLGIKTNLTIIQKLFLP